MMEGKDYIYLVFAALVLLMLAVQTYLRIQHIRLTEELVEIERIEGEALIEGLAPDSFLVPRGGL